MADRNGWFHFQDSAYSSFLPLERWLKIYLFFAGWSWSQQVLGKKDATWIGISSTTFLTYLVLCMWRGREREESHYAVSISLSRKMESYSLCISSCYLWILLPFLIYSLSWYWRLWSADRWFSVGAKSSFSASGLWIWISTLVESRNHHWSKSWGKIFRSMWLWNLSPVFFSKVRYLFMMP